MVSSGEKPAENQQHDSLSAPKPSPTNSSAADKDVSHVAESPAPSQLPKRSSTSPLPASRSPILTSPQASREASPIRPPQKPGTASAANMSRSRKNSHDLSPHRAPHISISTIPSAAAIQRAMSATGTPQLQSPTASDFTTDPQKVHRSGRGSSIGPITTAILPPRIKSPPPSASASRAMLQSPRKPESLPPSTPSITVERPTPSTASTFDSTDEEEELIRSGMKTPVRGISGSSTLETVHESSLPTTPANGSEISLPLRKTEDGKTLEENLIEDAGTKANIESNSDSGGNNLKSTGIKAELADRRKFTTTTSAVKPPTIATRKSVTQLNPVKNKAAGEGTLKNMTVETETVSSVPQVAVGGGAGERGLSGRADIGGSLRLKPSSETIRPKKEKKKTVRKAPSITSGTGEPFKRYHHHHMFARVPSPTKTRSQLAISPDMSPDLTSEQSYSTLTSDGDASGRVYSASSKTSLRQKSSQSYYSNKGLTGYRARAASSKADIFEAKVANAVDEANSSDSEETFVYESNPPEPLSARPHRYHSRTPSATSTVSQIDHHGGRHRSEGHHSIAGKKSMKFAHSSYHANGHSDGGDATQGVVNGNSGRITNSNSSHHHHTGRHGRGSAVHTSLFDNESPFIHANKPLRAANNSGRHPASPRGPHTGRSSVAPAKSAPLGYDLEGEAADDERTPLISARAGRNRYSRRPGGSRHTTYNEDKDHWYYRRASGCIFLGGLVGFLVTAIVIALIMCSKPLENVQIIKIQNVLASEQEIMLDLEVHAMNPNLVAIQVTDLDVNLFAKSKHVETGQMWRDRQRHRDRYHDPPSPVLSGTDDDARLYINGGVDEGNDPIEDPAQMLLLGNILAFDSPLIFDASPIRHQWSSSTGEIRLAKPGNSTDAGGRERWEQTLQYPFELIVRGVMRYTLPITSKVQSAPISGRRMVDPKKDISDKSNDMLKRWDFVIGSRKSWSRKGEVRQSSLIIKQ